MQFIVEAKPFLHAIIADVLGDDELGELLDQLEQAAWRSQKGSFHAFDTLDNPADESKIWQNILVSRAEAELRLLAEDIFDANFSAPVGMEVHRYRIGSGIGAHTDAQCNEARFVLNIGRAWQVQHGGLWVLSRTSDLKVDRKIISPLNNTGFLFLTSDISFHALSTRDGGAGYAVTIRFPLSP